jgi:hypothetical protein
VPVEEDFFMETSDLTSDLTSITLAHVSKPAHVSKDVSWGGTEEVYTGTEEVYTGSSSRDQLLGPLLSAQGHLVNAPERLRETDREREDTEQERDRDRQKRERETETEDTERERERERENREREREREETGDADTPGHVVGAVCAKEASVDDSFVAAPVEGDEDLEGAR